MLAAPLRILPVIDLMGGLVVRGIAGRRETYRPIESQLVADARPATVAQAFADLGFRQIYLADLDAIAGAEPAWPIYADLLARGLDLWVDAGLSNLERARDLAHFRAAGRPIDGIVAGLESLAGPHALAAICESVGRASLVFSLDLKHGVPLTAASAGELSAWQRFSALDIATIALRSGVRRMIVLDLAAVGMGAGVGTEPLCRQLRCLAPELQIVAGGGVRGPADLTSLARAGCDAALVASALHDGRLPARRL